MRPTFIADETLDLARVLRRLPLRFEWLRAVHGYGAARRILARRYRLQQRGEAARIEVSLSNFGLRCAGL